MNHKREKLIRELMEGKNLDEFWRRKVINSVNSIDVVFQTHISPDDIGYLQLDAESLWVNCEEEVDLNYANILETTLSVDRLAPITVVEYKGKYIIYMGSVRAVLFCRYQSIVDCIVVKLRTNNAAWFSDVAKKRLSDFEIL